MEPRLRKFFGREIAYAGRDPQRESCRGIARAPQTRASLRRQRRVQRLKVSLQIVGRPEGGIGDIRKHVICSRWNARITIDRERSVAAVEQISAGVAKPRVRFHVGHCGQDISHMGVIRPIKWLQKNLTS
jgi:hypothetical protein